MYHKWVQAPFKNNNEVEFLGYMLQVAWIKMFNGFAHVARPYIYLQHGGTLSLLPLCLRCFTLFLNCVQCLTLIFTQFVFHDFSFFLTSRLNIPFSSHFYNDSTFLRVVIFESPPSWNSFATNFGWNIFYKQTSF